MKSELEFMLWQRRGGFLSTSSMDNCELRLIHWQNAGSLETQAEIDQNVNVGGSGYVKQVASAVSSLFL